MDPLTQGALGASFAQTGNGQRWRQVRDATIVGALSGMAPDLDVLIQSPADPLLFLEYHRHFTHALLFIPIGALICSGVFYPFVRRRLSFSRVYLFSFLGYASHGVLDACTTYGTLLLWPFSEMRVAWNVVSVIDPLFSVPLGLGVALTFLRRSPLWCHIGLTWAAVYLMFGVWQHQRAEAAGWALAEARGHAPERLEAKPGFANLLVWKVVYEVNGHFYVDAVRVAGSVKVYSGERIEKLDLQRHLQWLDPESVQASDIERFRWFSNDYLALQQEDEVIDVRYSAVPNEIEPLWGIRLDRDADPQAHVAYFTAREVDAEQTERLWRMLRGFDI